MAMLAVALTVVAMTAVFATPSGALFVVFVVAVLFLVAELLSRAVWLLRAISSVHAVARRARESWRPRESLVPRSLPPIPDLLVGREAELNALRAHLCDLPANHAPATVVIHGEAGIGRTTLALWLAHTVADRYPDGQVYANLECVDVSASDFGRKQISLNDGLAVLIKALGTPWSTVPADFTGRVDIYRRLATDKRLLVVLDDARDEEPLAHLLPAGPGSVAIITSSGPIGHIASAKDVRIGPLTESDALALLETVVGNGQIERTAARRLVRGCEYHPLAIRLVGVALTSYSGSDVGEVVERLITAQQSAGRPATAPAGGILDGTYSTLTLDEQIALRCLGTMDTTIFAPWMFAAASGIEPHDCDVLVDRLTRAQLLTKLSGTSLRSSLYRVSPAVLTYARRRAAAEDKAVATERAERLRRAFQRRRDRSSQLLRANQLAEEGELAEAITVAREEIFLARKRNDEATEARSHAVLADQLTELGYISEALEAIDAAIQLDDPLSMASVYRVRGKIAYRQRRMTDAKADFDNALELAATAGARIEQARIHGERAIGLARAERYTPAHTDADHAMALSRELCARDPLPLFRALHAKATVHFYQGDPDASRPLLTEAGALLDDDHVLSRAWWYQATARVELAAGRTEAAMDRATAGINLFVRMRHRYGVAHCRFALGRVFIACQQDDAAIDAFREALTIFRDCGGDWIEGRTSLELAACHRRRQQGDRAAELQARAAEIFAAIGDSDWAVQAARSVVVPPLRRQLQEHLNSVNY